MRFALAILMTLLFVEHPVDAQIREFPYEAIVNADQVEIFSGAGYYATGRLNRGSRVVVYRHDPGGWYVIAPPAGSFSWIRAEYVRQSGGRTGTLTANNVLVRVGSSLSDSRDVYQERLSRGDQVEILGEKTFQSEQGAIRMYKIVPPRGEFRWIPGKFVTPIDEIARRQNDLNPYSVPSHARNSVPSKQASSAGSQSSDTKKPLSENTGQTEKIDGISMKGNSENSGNPFDRHQKMLEFDDQFRSIIKQETGEWDFDQLEGDYRALKKDVDDEILAAHLDQRLAAVKRYRDIKRQYDEFLELKTETTRRDVQLLAMQNEVVKEEPEEQQTPTSGAPILIPPQSRQAPPPIPYTTQTRVPPSMPIPVPRSIPGFPRQQIPAPQQQRIPVPRQQLIPAPQHQQIPEPQQQATRPPVFDGAGIIQRMNVRFPGAPSHVLTSPDGRILAYLKGSWGLSLDRFVGQSVGVNGSRSYHPGLRSQIIRVRTLKPVRLSR